MSVDTQSLFQKFETARVLVIGDFIVDIRTEVERVNPLDDATPVYRAIPDHMRGKTDIFTSGGAACVVRNLLELGATVDFVTAYAYGPGALHAHSWCPQRCHRQAIQVGKMQTVKHRYWCEGKKVFACDIIDNAPLTENEAASIIARYRSALGRADAVIVADYRHGLINEAMAKEIVSAANAAKKPIYVSSQVAQSESNHHWYDSEVTVFVMNDREWHSAGGSEVFQARKMIKTWGPLGSYIVNKDESTIAQRCVCTSAIKIVPVDACGAGDAFLAAYTLSGDMDFASTWAGLSCTVAGANPPTRKTLEAWYAEQDAD